jgi:hypothetical protein
LAFSRIDELFAFKDRADVLELCTDVSSRESNLARSMNIRKFLASLLKEDNRAAEAETALRRIQVANA